MKKSRILSFIVITCMLIALFPTSIVAESTHSTLSGTVSLPGNEAAPSGGITVKLNIYTDNLTESNKNDDVSMNRDLFIPHGQNSISYSIDVPKTSNRNARYSVSYTVDNNYAPFGWYSSNGTTPIKDNRTTVNLNGGNVSNINIVLLAAKLVTGKIILGNSNISPAHDMDFTITAIQEGNRAGTNDDDIIITQKAVLKADKQEVDWAMLVPLNTGRVGYKVFYEYNAGGYKEKGYYNSNGTTYVEATATSFDVINMSSGINLTTLPFTNLTGIVYLPEGITAPVNGFEVFVTAENNASTSTTSDDIKIMKSFKVPEYTSSVTYRLTVPVKQTGYILSYTVSDKTGFVTEGYYSSSGTQTSKSNATLIGTGTNAIGGLNLVVQKQLKPTSTPTPTPKPTGKPTPTPTPIPQDKEKYDLNKDGYINVFDLVDLAKVIVAQYKKDGFDKNLEQYRKHEMKAEDLKAIKEVFEPFSNNKYKLKWYNSWKSWFDYDWKNFNWDDIDWGDWNCDDDHKNDKKKNNGNGKK